MRELALPLHVEQVEEKPQAVVAGAKARACKRDAELPEVHHAIVVHVKHVEYVCSHRLGQCTQLRKSADEPVFGQGSMV